jgi:uncharacterized protein
MRRAILVCVILALGAELAVADGPSFDCGKAKAPIELLVCDDPELIRLDGLVGQAYASTLAESDAKETLTTEQRAWLASRFERCRIPKTGPALTHAHTRYSLVACSFRKPREISAHRPRTCSSCLTVRNGWPRAMASAGR